MEVEAHILQEALHPDLSTSHLHASCGLQQAHPAFYDRQEAITGNQATATPQLGFGFSNTDREYRLGWRLGHAEHNGGSFDLSVAATRHERTDDNPALEHRIGLELSLHW